MISEYYKYWTIKLHNMVSDQEKRCHSLRIAENQNKSNGILHEFSKPWKEHERELW